MSRTTMLSDMTLAQRIETNAARMDARGQTREAEVLRRLAGEVEMIRETGR